MLRVLAGYLRSMPLVVRKAKVMHRYSLFMDEATPEQLNKSLRAWRVIKREYGYLRSLSENQCVNAAGEPIPWYTYPAIEQISKWDFSDCDILEYGSGNSTLWWAKHARSVTSIENVPEWHKLVASRLPDNCKLILSPLDEDKEGLEQLEGYLGTIDDLHSFDVIIIDGVNFPGARYASMVRALSHLKPGGLFIIDNSDWLPLTCQKMREEGFFEIDFSGLGPLNDSAETTSFFFRKDFRIKPNSNVHPGNATGGYPWNKDMIE